MKRTTLTRAAIRLLTLAVSLSPCLLIFLSQTSADTPTDKEPVARWPAKANAEGQGFDGTQFVPFPSAPDVGKGPFAVWAWVKADDLAGGDPTWGRGIARSTRGEQVGDWILSVH